MWKGHGLTVTALKSCVLATKPNNSTVLMARISNLISLGDGAHEHFLLSPVGLSLT
jgi:hypothetical protein